MAELLACTCTKSECFSLGVAAQGGAGGEAGAAAAHRGRHERRGSASRRAWHCGARRPGNGHARPCWGHALPPAGAGSQRRQDCHPQDSADQPGAPRAIRPDGLRLGWQHYGSAVRLVLPTVCLDAMIKKIPPSVNAKQLQCNV